MKKLLTMFGLLCLSISMAQTYTGTVKDSKNTPISYANVIAKDTKNDQTLNAVITNKNGKFHLKMDSKLPFYIEISYLGFENQKIIPKSLQTDLGVIQLKEENVNLEGVVVTTRKKLIEQKADRMVFSVENSVSASGGDALELLKKTPGVNVEKENISIIGKGNVRVLINDRMVQLSGEQLTNYLATFSADDIKSIEVITTPPAKYDAEGNSGLINIVMKKPKENSWSDQVRTTYYQATYPTFKFGNTFNYSNKKWHITTSVDAAEDKDKNYSRYKVNYPNALWSDRTNGVEKNNSFSGRLGIDYDITPRATIGTLYSGDDSKWNNRFVGLTKILDSNTQIGQLNSDAKGESHTKNHSLNLHYIQKLDTLGRKLSVDFDYFTYERDQGRIFESNQTGNRNHFVKANNKSEQDIDNYSIRLDMEHPFSWANMSYGAKFTQTKNKSSAQYFDLSSGISILDPNQSDTFHYTENISAIYWDASKSFGEKWKTKLGLRLENTQTKGTSESYNQTDKRNYTRLFPTVYISYNPTKNHNFNLSYNRRINRPSFWQLNPFRWYINANSYAVGNPFLQPSISDNIRFTHTYKNTFTTGLYVKFKNDGTGQVIEADTSKKQIIYAWENFYKSVSYGIEEMIVYNPFSWWNTSTKIDLFTSKNQYINDFDLGKMSSKWSFYFMTNHNFSLNSEGTISAEVSLYYVSPMQYQFAEISKQINAEIGFKMQLLDKNLQLSASVNDIFKMSNPVIKVKTNGIPQEYYGYNDNQYLKVGLSYKFGNQKIRVQERKSGNSEEMSRTR